jgi:general secretion pathway protein G
MIQRLRQMRNEEGFTLIELLIVIIVLGILAAIVVFAVSGTRGDAVASRCKTDIKAVELSAEAVYAKQGSYPVGTIDDTTENTATAAIENALLDGFLVSGVKNGALLKSWPDSSDVRLVYTGTASTATLQVQKKNSSGTWTNTASTGVAGCTQSV